MSLNEDVILEALRAIKDPETRRDIVGLNLINNLRVTEQGAVSLEFNSLASGTAVPDNLVAEVKKQIIMLPGVKSVQVDTGKNQSAEVPDPNNTLKHVKHVIAVASAKGGVGKSTVSVNIAAALSSTGLKVGLLDGDIYGPNVPLMAGAEGMEPTVAVYTDAQGNNREFLEPIQVNGMKVMSMGFLVHPGQPVMWRGPMLNSAIRQFLGQVDWGELDYLVIDLPPGTGDVQISLLQMVPVSGIVHVTTPQEVALQDVRRGVAMFASKNVPVLGIIENMSFYQCPHCNEASHIFSSGGGGQIAQDLAVPLIGSIPVDIRIREAGDQGKPIVLQDPTGPVGKVFMEAVDLITKTLENGEITGTKVSPFARQQELINK